MARQIFLMLTGMLLSISLISQGVVQNNAFSAGEKLSYKITYISYFNEINAGEATVEIRNETFENRPFYHLLGVGRSNKFFDVFYKVRDKFESKVDQSSLLPYSFIRTTREGNFVFDDTVSFDWKIGIASSIRKQTHVPDKVFDIVSGVYFMRTLSVEDFGKDSIYHLNFYLDDSVYNAIIKYEGRGVVKTEWGWIPCLKVKPMMVTGEVFTNKYPMVVWITDDENHVPVLAESGIVIGSVKMELSGFEGLKHPFLESLSKDEVDNYE